MIEKTHQKSKSEYESLNIVKEIIQLKKEEEDFRIKVKNLKLNELRRLNKEFLCNDYENRFEIHLEQVVSALIGEEFISNEIYQQIRDQRVLYFYV